MSKNPPFFKLKKFILSKSHLCKNEFYIFIALTLFAILYTIIFYDPFNQPIFFDRAYFVYMAQVVARGDDLYEATTFGYTPLSILISGLAIKVGALFSIPFLIVIKLTGLIVYGLICSYTYKFSALLFKSRKLALGVYIFLLGLGFLNVIAGVHAEPKLWVILFTLIGAIFYSKEKWVLTGIFISFSAMCWHVAAVSVIAFGIANIFQYKRISKSTFQYIVGLAIGTIPVLIYLFATDDWLSFWQQAIERKIFVEGDVVGESPSLWLINSFYPSFLPEILHFILSSVGFAIMLIYRFTSQLKIKQKITNIAAFDLVLILLFSWIIFNTLEFQGTLDIFPILPFMMICAIFFLSQIIPVHLRKWKIIAILTFIIFINFGDAVFYKLPFTFNDQEKLIKEINDSYSNPLAVNFVEFFAVLNKPMPTKFITFASYEDFLINKMEGGCSEITSQLKKKNVSYLILRSSKGSVSSQKIKKLNKLFKIKGLQMMKTGECIENLTQNIDLEKPLSTYEFQYQAFPNGWDWYNTKYYLVYQLWD